MSGDERRLPLSGGMLAAIIDRAIRKELREQLARGEIAIATDVAARRDTVVRGDTGERLLGPDGQWYTVVGGWHTGTTGEDE